MFLDLLISGLLAGSLYALVALGMVVIYKATDVVNFAQGEMVMAGGYFGILFHNTLGLGWTVTILATLASSLVLGLVLERVANRPLMRAAPFTVIIELWPKYDVWVVFPSAVLTVRGRPNGS